jgi:hypothetical protein
MARALRDNDMNIAKAFAALPAHFQTEDNHRRMTSVKNILEARNA